MSALFVSGAEMQRDGCAGGMDGGGEECCAEDCEEVHPGMDVVWVAGRQEY